MCTPEEYQRRAWIVKEAFQEQLNRKSLKYNWHDGEVTILEGIMARGDRRVSKLIEAAYENGCLFDAWTETFSFARWQEAIQQTQTDLDFYTIRPRDLDELLPWDFIDLGVSKAFLKREWLQATQAQVTPNCREHCSGCGAAQFGGGICYEGKN
jgi:hypothetical protein